VNNRAVIGTMYLIITLICVLVSTYASFQGYKTTLRLLAFPGALLIGMGLFASDMVIKDGIRSRQAPLGALVFFAIVLLFSTMSNFNHFYTNFMQNKAAQTTYIDAYQKFESNMGVAKNVIAKDPEYSSAIKTEKYVKQELTNLRNQSQDPNNPGIGIEARGHQENIQDQLDVRVTNFAYPNNADATSVKNWVDTFEVAALSNLEQQLSPTLLKYEGTLNDIDTYLRDYKKKTESVNNDGWRFSAIDKLNLVDEISQTTRRLEGQVNNLVVGEQADLDMDYISKEEGQLGEIVYTLHHGFIRRPNVGVTMLSMILSMFIDLLPLLFALLLMRPRAGQFEHTSADGPRPNSGGLNIRN